MAEFAYDNLVGRPAGPMVRISSRLSRNVRTVQAQVEPYARAWRESNVVEMSHQGALMVVLGDSMAQGVGASSPHKSWAGQLRDQLQQAGKNYRLLNLSQSGARIGDVIERQLPVLESLGITPDLVVVMVGSNDLIRRKYRLQALQLFNKLLVRLPNGSVVANLPGLHGVPVLIDRSLRQKASDGRLIVADMRSQGPKDWRGRLAADHFHPNDVGYKALADVFARTLGL